MQRRTNEILGISETFWKGQGELCITYIMEKSLKSSIHVEKNTERGLLLLCQRKLLNQL